jgi:hypothetical protein
LALIVRAEHALPERAMKLTIVPAELTGVARAVTANGRWAIFSSC